LIVGGTAAMALAGGAAVRGRLSRATARSRSRPAFDLKKLADLDLDKVGSAAERIGDYGRRVDEIAKAIKRASDATGKD
jgi:hypothetical protein